MATFFFGAYDNVNGWELRKFDGVTASLVTNLNISGDSFPESLTVFNDALYFVATTSQTGYELWRFDGVNVSMVADINPGSNSSFPSNLKIFNNQLVFSADATGAFDFEPWALITAPFEIQSLQLAENQAEIIWKTLGGTTNIVQAAGNIAGPFTNISEAIKIGGFGTTTTNFVDPEPATQASRFYRLVEP